MAAKCTMILAPSYADHVGSLRPGDVTGGWPHHGEVGMLGEIFCQVTKEPLRCLFPINLCRSGVHNHHRFLLVPLEHLVKTIESCPKDDDERRESFQQLEGVQNGLISLP